MADRTEQSAHPVSRESNIAGKQPRVSVEDISRAQAGPGELAIQLRLVKEHLRDLESDHTLPEKEREINRGFYTHEREKLQLRLTILDKNEKAEFDERAQSELPTASAALLRLLQDDSKWIEQQSAVRRWE